jgi:hypothetical protein
MQVSGSTQKFLSIMFMLKGHGRNGCEEVTRLCHIYVHSHNKDEERFYLRKLLLHVKGATSFDSQKTADVIMCKTCKAAAAL